MPVSSVFIHHLSQVIPVRWDAAFTGLIDLTADAEMINGQLPGAVVCCVTD